MQRSVFVVGLLVIWLTLAGCAVLDARPHLEIAGPPPDLAASGSPTGGLEVTFLGTSTLLIDDGVNAILIDGFFTRPGLSQVLFGEMQPDGARIDQALAGLPRDRIRAILVAHSHFDHALDSGTIARGRPIRVFGSASTAALMQAEDLAPGQAVRLEHENCVSVPGFAVTPYETGHSRGNLASGEITGTPVLPMSARAYRADGSLSWLIQHARGTILVVPAANFRQGALAGVSADVVFLSIGFLGRQPESFVVDYWRETVRASGASVVVPIHWDDLFQPLQAPLPPLPYAFDRVDVALDRLRALARGNGVRLVTLDAYQSIDVSRIGAPPAREPPGQCTPV